MCAGSILASGFNVGVINYDKGGGINMEENAKFNSYKNSEKIHEKLTQNFGYYSI